MHWQDLVIASSYIIFDLALIPSILGKDKPAFKTSLVTGFFNLVIAFTQFTLGLIYSSVAVFICGVLWLILAYQKRKS